MGKMVPLMVLAGCALPIPSPDKLGKRRLVKPIFGAVFPLLAVGCAPAPHAFVEASNPVQLALDGEPAPVEVVERYADEGTIGPVDDTLVSDPNSDILDPEFESTSMQVVWVEGDPGTVWVADMTDDGLMVPQDGRGTLIATDAVPMAVMHNGPEWILAADGPHVLYSRSQRRHEQMTHAFEGPNGWTSEPLTGDNEGVVGNGSMLAGDPAPLIAYWHQPSDEMRWRTLLGDRQGTLGLMNSVAAPTFVQDLVAWNVAVDRVPQVFLFDAVDSAAPAEQLTSGPDAHTQPKIWLAPELEDELVILVSMGGDGKDATSIETWRQFDEVWAPVQRIYPPAAYPLVRSPELLVLGGSSYVVFVASAETVEAGSQIWLASALPEGDDVLRRVSGDQPWTRRDPEVLILEDQAWIYYGTRKTIRRCDAGL